MVDVYVRNYRHIAKADLTFNRLCVVAGGNMQGKSSIAEAVRAALTGIGLALDGAGKKLTKKESAPALVRWGAEKGSCMVRMDDSSATMFWPKCEYETQGLSPPSSSRMGAGIDSLMRMDEKARARFLFDLLKANPTEAELVEALEEAKIGRAGDVAKLVMGIVEKNREGGWDEAQKKAQERGAKLKGQWAEASGEDWGADKAQDWKPEGWNPKWDSLDVALATDGVALLEKELVAFDEANGKATGALDYMREKAATLEALEKATASLPNTTTFGEALVAAETVRNALPPSADLAEEVYPCPHCSELLAVAPGQSPPWRMVSKTRPTKAQVADLRRKIDVANQDVLIAKNALAAAHNMIATHEAKLTEARNAAEALKTAKEPTNQEERAGILTRIERGRNAIRLITAKTRAGEIDALIRENQRLGAILAPTGLRQKKTAVALGEFNERLGNLCEWMGSDIIAIGDDMSLASASEEGKLVDYWLMSASQQFRARIVLQATIAAYDGSKLIVVDNDVDQDSSWLHGTIQMLGKLSIPALITVRADSPADVPDLPVKTIYWTGKDGIVKPLAEMLEEAA